MRVPLSWLVEFAPLGVEPDDKAAVADLMASFADLGLVPESVDYVGAELEGVVVARVEEISPIAGADRIRRVIVDAGGPVEVVCGAWNFEVGSVVPLATVGTVLPGADAPLERRKMRGATSNGMLCSGVELGLSDDHAGLLLLEADLQPGRPMAEVLDLGPDVVFDLEVQANRPDCLSIAGIARDIAARWGVPFSLPLPPARNGIWAKGGAGEKVVAAGATIEVDTPELCGRFLARVIRSLEVRPSPPKVARRLRFCGMRPLNNLVDASNYVMLELGQPTHPYDLDRLPGAGLAVRRGRPGESLVTLDGAQRALSGADCVITDADGSAVGVAGVMGGASSEISESTSEVLLEAAWFEPMAIAATARRLGLRTEASARFEKGCDPSGIERALDRYCEVLGLTPSDVEATLEVTAAPPVATPVRLRLARCNALLGLELSSDQVISLLAPLGFVAASRADATIEVEVPSWRPDCSREVDVVEEVARLYGYGAVPPTVRRPTQVGVLTPLQELRRRVRSLLAGSGADEAWTATLVGPGDHGRAKVTGSGVSIANPMVAEESVLRSTMLMGLVGAAGRNLARGEAGVRLFELGTTFGLPTSDSPLPVETERAALVLAGAGDDASATVRTWRALASGLRLAEVELQARPVPGLHPGRGCVLVDSSGSEIGVLGEVDPEVAEAFGAGTRRLGWLEVSIGALLAAPRRSEIISAPSRFPAAEFDLAFVVEEAVAAATVERALRRAAGDVLVGLSLFDVFRGESLASGQRSLAWHLKLEAADHTLDESELAEHRRRCVAAVESAGLGTLRS